VEGCRLGTATSYPRAELFSGEQTGTLTRLGRQSSIPPSMAK
jgi:hypothetical protein